MQQKDAESQVLPTQVHRLDRKDANPEPDHDGQLGPLSKFASVTGIPTHNMNNETIFRGTTLKTLSYTSRTTKDKGQWSSKTIWS